MRILALAAVLLASCVPAMPQDGGCTINFDGTWSCDASGALTKPRKDPATVEPTPAP